MRFLRPLRIALWSLLAVILLATAALNLGLLSFIADPDAPRSVGTGAPDIGGPFRLTTHEGETLTDEDLRGRPYAVFFGFTHCPDICPTTLYELSTLLDELGPEADELVPLFISVDPERDTPETLADYVSAFDESIVGLTGTPDEVANAAEAFRAYYEKVPQEGGGYTMNHQASVLLMDDEGQFFGTVDAHKPREAQLQKLRRLLEA